MSNVRPDPIVVAAGIVSVMGSGVLLQITGGVTKLNPLGPKKSILNFTLTPVITVIQTLLQLTFKLFQKT
jgi:hypothetical protein